MILVIKDNRDGRVFLDNEGIIRNFETELDRGSYKAMKKKYPDAVDLVKTQKEDEGPENLKRAFRL